jgi:hypothetical protein
MVIPWWDWIGKAADVLSVFTLLAAGAAWWQLRQITKRYQALIRLPEHVAALQEAASAVVYAAPDAADNRDGVLDAFSTVEGKLTSVQGWIGSRYSLDSRRRELVSEIIEVRDSLKSRQARGAPMDKDIAIAEYRKIMRVTDRVVDYVEDRRLER